ncbi:Crp/Fnr family transcriptional regulator [Variovorax sp. PAMC28562]|nr:Crp/Fnr family transcriptional regulator [Variovorax sp. PAMC28562]
MRQQPKAFLPTSSNQMIERLPRAARSRLIALCEPHPLVLSEVLCEAKTSTRHVYFPTEGFISLVSVIDGNQGIEVGMVGQEGMLGAHLALGVASQPLHALVQGTGSALRINARAFRVELSQSPALQSAVFRYLHVLMAQLAVSTACVRFHSVQPRLARWLLMSQDRAASDGFRVTHEFLAYMLGVRRVGITSAASALRRDGLISYHRGDVTVLDRKGLEAAACTCYAADCRSYAAVMG